MKALAVLIPSADQRFVSRYHENYVNGIDLVMKMSNLARKL
jgi:hypothetical protein